jgi:beta-glucosidase/6-phospho-beta-glucosidase/beta-galactosidase
MFKSFFFAGFEGTCGLNRHHQWIDQIVATQHDRYVDADYGRLKKVGLLAARESVRWPLVDRNGHYDFSSIEPMLRASRRHGVEVIWDFFHYGFPAGLDPFSDAFARRFADYCHATAKYLNHGRGNPLYITPINEPSYLAWAAGEAARFSPHREGCGRDLKIALIRAALAGINAIRAAVPDARIVNVDPICNIVPPTDRPDLTAEVADFNFNAVFEAWDMLSGRLYPELGGSPAHLDIVGVNYYWTNEWEIGREEDPLALDDPRRVPISDLLRRVHDRYGAEILLTETAHVDDQRPEWLNCIAAEARRAREAGVPLKGVCLYPILGMPEWHDPRLWVRMGLWDLQEQDGQLVRQLHEPSLQALRLAQQLVEPKAPMRPARIQPGSPLPIPPRAG